MLCTHAQSRPTLCDCMDSSPPGSSAHGIIPGKNTGVGCHFLLWGIFLTQGLNQCLLQWQADSLPPSHKGSPCILNIPLAPFFTHLKVFPPSSSSLHPNTKVDRHQKLPLQFPSIEVKFLHSQLTTH